MKTSRKLCKILKHYEESERNMRKDENNMQRYKLKQIKGTKIFSVQSGNQIFVKLYTRKDTLAT